DARDLLTLQAAGAASRTDARAIEHLRGVDITDPGDDALIHDQVLDCDLASPRSGGQIVGVKLIRERFRAKPFHFAQGGKGGARDQAHDSEAARVIEDQPGTVVESELDMIVATVELRGIEIAVATGKAPAHPQVNQDHVLAVEIQNQVLGAPPDVLDPPPPDARAEVGSRLATQGQTADSGAHNRPADHAALQDLPE